MKKDRKATTIYYFLSILTAMAIICGSTYAQDIAPAGHTIFVHDAVWRVSEGLEKQPLQKGDSVYETDTIITSKNGSAQLMMSDGAYIAIRPNTSIRLDVYHYDAKEKKGLGESVITLLKGCFRSITGMIGKQNKENYRIKTAVATIGIRGTDHEPLYIPEPEEGEVPIGEPGLYDKVNSGETYIENEAGVVTILPNQVGFVSDQTTVAIVEDTVPDVYEQFNNTVSEESVELSATQVTSGQTYDPPPPPPILPPNMPAVVAEPVVKYAGTITWPDTNGTIGFAADETEVNTDESGNLTGYQLSTQSLQIDNPTDATRQESDHYSETTIEYGTWQADNIIRTNYGEIPETETFAVGNGLVHWINGIVSDSDYLSQVLTGTQTYTFDGGTTPTNQDGIAGTLNSATLEVDFSRQAVDAALQLDMNGSAWSASATDIILDSGAFTADGPLLTVERDGSDEFTWGNLTGTFAGEGLNGAMFGYTLGDTSISETINGTASFYAPAQDTNTLYREIGVAAADLAWYSPSATASISTDGSGNLTGFDTMLSTTPVDLDIGAATLTDTGTDTDSGITWGRWSGTITATDRVTEGPLVPTFAPDNLHFIAGPEMSSSVVLPIAGTKTYQLAGGTRPTDNNGLTGTLNSATLSADFTNMTVAAGINATVGTTTFDATSVATPIESGRYFNATHNDSLSIACTGTNVGTTNTGVISGAFYGEHGESAGAAYSFNTTDGGSINTTISGTAAFK